VCLALFFALVNRRKHDDQEAAGHIDESEDFYLNGDEGHPHLFQVSPILVSSVM
jgi:hypothetical protein